MWVMAGCLHGLSSLVVWAGSEAVSAHLERGKKLLQDGNLHEALEQYNMAVGKSP